MFRAIKKIVSIVLIVAMILSNAGMEVLAESFDNEQTTTTINENAGENLFGEKTNPDNGIVSEEKNSDNEKSGDKENLEDKEENEKPEDKEKPEENEKPEDKEKPEEKEDDKEGSTESEGENEEGTSEEKKECSIEGTSESSGESTTESTSEGGSEGSSESINESTSESTVESINNNTTINLDTTKANQNKIENEENTVTDFTATASNIEENNNITEADNEENNIATNSNIQDIMDQVDFTEYQSTNGNELFGSNPNMNYGTLIDLAEADRLDLDYNWFNKFFGTGYFKDDIKKIEFKAGVDINGRGWNLLEEVTDTTHGKVYKLLSKANVGSAMWSWQGDGGKGHYPYPPYDQGSFHHDGAGPYKFLRDQFYPSFPQYYRDNMILMHTEEDTWAKGSYPGTVREFDSYIRIPTADEIDSFVGVDWDDLDRLHAKLKNGESWWVLEHIYRQGYGMHPYVTASFPADGNYDPRHGVGHGGDTYTNFKVHSESDGIRAVMTMTKEGLKPEPGTAGEPIYTYEIYNTDDTSAANRKLIGLAFLFINTTGGYDVEIHMLYGNAFKFAEDNAQALFVNFNNLKEIGGLDLLDFSETTNMSSMFEGCTALDTFTFVDENLTKLQDTFGASATNLDSMFKDCEELTNVDFLPDNFASGATTMVSTFENTKISSCPTNINTSNVTDMTRTFAKLQSTTFKFDSIDLSACTNVTEMFADSNTLTTITVDNNYLGLPNNVTTKTDMFHNSPNLTGGGGFRYKDQFASGDFARVDYGGIIPGYFTCNDLTVYNNLDICIDNTWRTNFEASGVLTGARKIIFTHEALPGGDADDIDMPIKVNGVDITGKAFLMHSDGSLIIQFVSQIHNLSTTDTWNRFFQNFVNVTNIEGLDLIDTSPITTLEQTFNNCRNLATISIADFETINVTTIESAFEGCEKLTGFAGDIPEFSSLVNAQYAFKGCSSLKTIDIDPFFTSGLLYIKEMFRGCSSLTNIYTDNRTVNCTLSIDIYNSENMFDGCTSLTGGQGTVYINEYPKNINMANTDFGGIKPGYFTLTNTNLYNNVTFTVPNTWYNLANYLRAKTNVKEVQFIEGSPSPGDFTVMYDMDGSYDKVKLYIKTDTDGKYIAKIYTGCSLIHKTKLSTTLVDFFSGFTSLTQVSGWDKVDMTATTNMKGMFKDCSSLTSLDLTLFDTSEITNMSEMFRGCTNLATITVTPNFVTTKVTNSDNMFTGCNALTGDHGTTYTNKHTVDPVTAVDKTFATLDARHGLDGYFTLSGTTTGYNVSSISVKTKPETNYYIGDHFFPNGLVLNVTWDDNVTTQVAYTAVNAAKFTFDPATDHDLTPADTTETVTYGGKTTSFTLTINPAIAYTLANTWFTGAGVNKNTVRSISFIKYPEASPSTITSEWDLPDSNGLKGYVITDGAENDIVVYAPHVGTILGAQDSSYLFSDTSPANSFRNLTTFNNLSYLVTSRMTDMSGMFSNCVKLQTLNLNSFNTLNVTDMQNMFDGCEELVSVNTSSFNTSKVINMNSMFYNCKKLTQVNTNNFNTSSARDMACMFYECNLLASLDVSKFNTSGVTDMQGMFYNCSELTSLNLGGFNMKLVTSTENMFKGCVKLTSIGSVNLSSSEIKTCKSMFEGCAELTSVNMSNFNTANIGSDGFESMFSGCTKVKTISLGSNFVLGGATTLANMFNGCEALTSINLSSFASNSVNNVTAMFKNNRSLKTIVASNSFAVKNKTGSDMFENCDALEGGAGTTFAAAGVANSSYAQVDEGNTNPGYFTWGGDVTITFVGGEGAGGAMTPQIVKRNVSTPLNKNRFYKGGYTFLYWRDDAGNTYTNTIVAYNSVTLVAQWRQNPPVNPDDGGSSGTSGGGGGGGPRIGNSGMTPVTYVQTVKTISAVFDETQVKWNYNPSSNKFKLIATINGQEVPVSNGFYVINSMYNNGVFRSPMPDTYYFNAAGDMITGWIITIDTKKYFADTAKSMDEGKFAAGWKVIDGYWYFFDFEGAMLVNTRTPDGFLVGADGRWIRE